MSIFSTKILNSTTVFWENGSCIQSFAVKLWMLGFT